MDVVGQGPLRVGSVLWQPAPGAFSLTVVSKLTFALAPGESPLAEEQEEIYDADAHWDDDHGRSLVQAMDLVPGKARPEVLLVGSAYSPDLEPVASLAVRLRFGDIDKAFRVWGDRWFSHDGMLQGPTEFVRMPLLWERAAAASTTENPVGIRMGRDARPDARGRVLVPNIEPLGVVLRSKDETFAPTGFGPIAATWRPRLDRFPRHAASWDPACWSPAPLPGAFDFGFWNAAPLDQHLPALRGDEPLFLENLDRRYQRLSTRLARVRPRARVQWASGASRDVPLTPDTLIIDTDRALAMLVFRGAVALDHPDQVGLVMVEPVFSKVDPAMTIAFVGAPERPSLPFAASDADGAHTLAPGFDLSSSTLPFRHHASPVGPDWLAPMAVQPRDLAPADVDALPFRRASAGGATSDEALPTSVAALPASADSFDMPELTLALSPSLDVTAPSPEAVKSQERAPLEERYEGLARTGSDKSAELEVEADTVLPPPMIGPLATPEMAFARAAGEVLAVAEAPPAVEIAAEVLEAKPLPLPLEEVSLLRCAALDASFACRPQETEEILKTACLDAATWQRLKTHYASAVRTETRRASSASLKAYDAAYMAQLEKERGPISVEEFAAMMVANERGELGQALEALRIPNAELIRIQRIWISRSAGDPALGASTKEAMTKARAALHA